MPRDLIQIDQQERNNYDKLLKSNGNDYEKSTKIYAQQHNRSLNDIFGEVVRNKDFIQKAKKFNFSTFTENDWDNFWLIAQHCDFDRDFQKWALSVIKKYTGVNNDHYRYLFDRISCVLTQKYGTQDICKKCSFSAI